VTLFSGASNHGQGHETAFKQIVNDRLGIDPREITYVKDDTDQVFFGEGTGGSRSGTIGGAAVLMATDKIKTKATAIAAHLLKVAPEDLRFEDGIFSSQKTNQTMTLKEIALAAANPAKLPKDMEAGLIATAVYNLTTENYPNGCHVCEVEVDEDTGVVEVLRYSVVDDVGTVINPLLVHGQIVGGVAQGAGQVLMEDVRFDTDSGQIMTGSFMDYAMPRASDLSSVAMKSNPVPTKTNPLGVKGCGEAGCVGALPAVANAVVDALSVLGVRHIDIPVTPERVWRAIREARAQAAE
jgi:carbon-monoxide dehydrogenase large subunit